jgi:hypothetical protein
MKKAYLRPALVEYGTVERLTWGQGGTEPDFTIGPGGTLINVNNNCDAGGTATACLVPATP